MSNSPAKICTNLDDYSARLIGTTSDGKQFFITQPFVPHGNDFVARYVFDQEGKFLNAVIHDLGVRKSGEPPGNALFENETVEMLEQELLNDLGDYKFGDIEVCPFSYKYNDIVFGLIAEKGDESDDEWTVIAEPGNYMAFYSPWDGDYDT